MGYDVHRLTEGRKLILGGVDHLAAAAIIRDYKEARACVDYSC